MKDSNEHNQSDLTPSRLKEIIDDYDWKCRQAKKKNQKTGLTEQKRSLHYFRMLYEKITGERY